MTKYNITRNDKKIFVSVVGHAERKSENLSAVCGMISAVTQSALAGCMKYGNTNTYIMDKGIGRLTFETDSNKITRAIIYSMERGLAAIAEQFPEYLRKE